MSERSYRGARVVSEKCYMQEAERPEAGAKRQEARGNFLPDAISNRDEEILLLQRTRLEG
jgi:hypothetical protein